MQWDRRRNNYARIGVLGLAIGLALSGCYEEKVVISDNAMMTPKDGKGPWLLVTYQGTKVKWPTVALRDGRVVDTSMSVYVTNQGRLETRSGKPVTTLDGEALYWNEQGLIITRSKKSIDKNRVFSIDDEVMPSGTPLRIERRGEFTHAAGRITKG